MLNHEQQKAVESQDRFIFLLAGAGSGKTRVIVERIKRMINLGISVETILAITFTRKASQEMKQRLNQSKTRVTTFHQLAYVILKEELHRQFDMVDERITSLYKDEELLEISKYKNSMYQYPKPRQFERYQKDLKLHQMLDFDDLLIELLIGLKSGLILTKYTHIFIDEFQDTNDLQYQILKKMIHHNTQMFAVGDPDQSIYQFRGANSKIIDLYVKEFHAKLYLLSLNYRSDQMIITTANRLIKRNHRVYKKELIATHQSSGLVLYQRFKTNDEEVKWVLKMIEKLHQEGLPFEEIVILYRNHQRVFLLLLKMHESGFPFQMKYDDDIENSGVQLMTIHQAKGLEFSVVIILGCEHNVFPSTRLNMMSELEEERRLMFVAMTRAKHILFLTSVTFDQDNHHFTSSKFIAESGLKSSNPLGNSDIISLGDNDECQIKNTRTNKNHQSSKSRLPSTRSANDE